MRASAVVAKSLLSYHSHAELEIVAHRLTVAGFPTAKVGGHGLLVLHPWIGATAHITRIAPAGRYSDGIDTPLVV